MIVNRSNLSVLFRAYNAVFHDAFATATPQWNLVATEVPSTTAENEYGWLGQVPRMREWIGDRVINNLKVHGFSIRNKPFESTVGVPVDNIKDDTYGVYTPLMRALGQAAAEHPDELTFGLLKNGFTGLCYDGQNFFDNDHPVIDETGAIVSVSNFGGGSGPAWYLVDDSRPIKPLIFQMRERAGFVALTEPTDSGVFMDGEAKYGVNGRWNTGFGLWQLAHASKQELNSANFNTAFAAMEGMKGDHARPLALKPRKLIVPPTLRSQALDVIKAERLANGQTNTNRDVVEVVSVPWLA